MILFFAVTTMEYLTVSKWRKSSNQIIHIWKNKRILFKIHKKNTHAAQIYVFLSPFKIMYLFSVLIKLKSFFVSLFLHQKICKYWSPFLWHFSRLHIYLFIYLNFLSFFFYLYIKLLVSQTFPHQFSIFDI